MSRYKDFDSFIAEQTGEPVRFKYKGVEFSLPSELPAIVPLTAARLQRDKTIVAQEKLAETTLTLAEGVFGSQLDSLLATGISINDLGNVINWVIEAYTNPNASTEIDEDEELKNSPALKGQK